MHFPIDNSAQNRTWPIEKRSQSRIPGMRQRIGQQVFKTMRKYHPIGCRWDHKVVQVQIFLATGRRLTAFHTHDGIYCWNRLLMGAKPSSAVQQSAYLEALDQYIDYDWDGNVRKCLLDKTLMHELAATLCMYRNVTKRLPVWVGGEPDV